MERYLVKKNGVEYLNGGGQVVVAPINTIISMVRRADVVKYLRSASIVPADNESRIASIMTTKSIHVPEVTPEVTPEEETTPLLEESDPQMDGFNLGDLVGFARDGEEFTGTVQSISAKGALSINIGVENEERVVRIHPRKIKVEKLS